MITERLLNKETKLAVIGLGYVGLPVALAFSKKVNVIGFDVNMQRIEALKQNTDLSKEIPPSSFDGGEILFTSKEQNLQAASFYIVTVPTPVDEHNVPDLSMLKQASETVGRSLIKGDYIVFESTVYPSCTEEECIPLVEKSSGLQAVKDFKYGYSPERINPGDNEHTLQNIIKIVSGCDEESLQEIAKVYDLIIEAGVFKTSSVRVAEAAKVIENTQRDLNIALMNELSIIFCKLGINTYEVLEAAKTKWNFLPFKPGLVGGHCIGVDPYYLTYKANELGYSSKVITAGRYINDSMGAYVANKIIRHLIQYAENVRDAKVLIMGATFKENIADVRNSKVADIVKTLTSFHLNVHVIDPLACSKDLKNEYGIELINETDDNYDAVIIAVLHDAYKGCDEQYFTSITKPHALIADIKGFYRNKIVNRQYWSL